jgi:hypothetical protein
MMPTQTDSSQQADVRTLDTVEHGPLPVLDVWKECRNTGTGWTGINEKGERLDIRLREPDAFGPARMPDKDYAVLVRPAGPCEYGDVSGHVPVGVALIERAARARAKKKAPVGGRGG